MNAKLEAKIHEAQGLPEADQALLAEFMGDFIDSARSSAQFAESMKDPAYRDYIEEGVAAGEADLAAGRFAPARDVLPNVVAKFKAEHGL
ncbi:MAG: hypothetical protein AAGC93_19990 [Cyanobacteria bacterium P01_F01_bin.53]